MSESYCDPKSFNEWARTGEYDPASLWDEQGVLQACSANGPCARNHVICRIDRRRFSDVGGLSNYYSLHVYCTWSWLGVRVMLSESPRRLRHVLCSCLSYIQHMIPGRLRKISEGSRKLGRKVPEDRTPRPRQTRDYAHGSRKVSGRHRKARCQILRSCVWKNRPCKSCLTPSCILSRGNCGGVMVVVVVVSLVLVFIVVELVVGMVASVVLVVGWSTWTACHFPSTQTCNE